MLYEIKHRFTGSVLFSLECDSLKLCVEAAVKADANLVGADLADADLVGADLVGAYLADADLERAYLADANLVRANLVRANLVGADLARANLVGAYLVGAYLADANLVGANLARAYLADADLADAKNIPTLAVAQTRILPDGDLIGWKNANGIIIKLRIPEAAKRSHAFGRKCRAEYVIDLGHWDIDGNALPLAHEAITTQHGPRTIYRCGETIRADSWDEDFTRECSHGIHFFITREEALNWN